MVLGGGVRQAVPVLPGEPDVTPTTPKVVNKILRLEPAVDLAAIDRFKFGNPRHMTDRKRAALGAAVNDIGFAEPIVAREVPGVPGRYEILNGHHRYDLLRDSGAATAPLVVVDVPDDMKARALVLASGNIHADWDAELEAFIGAMMADGATPSWVQDVTAFTAADAEILASAGTEFLDDVIGGDPEDGWGGLDEPGPPARATTGLVSFTAHLTPDQNEAVYGALRAAKKTGGVGTTSAALDLICRAFTAGRVVP